MESDERKALRVWAEDRLRALESGDSLSVGWLPHTLDVERLWALYFLSVEERDWEEPAVTLADSLKQADLPESAHVRALGAALEVVRAKNSRWPPNKLKHLRSGITALNTLVELHPRDPVIRYLRLMSCYYLPFFLDQDELVQEDLAVLGSLLPKASADFSPYVYRGVLRFVLDKGEYGEDVRGLLAASLAAMEGEG
jgi:hypothetical protein